MHTTHFITNDPIGAELLKTGLQTAFYDEGNGEAVVFVHGFTGSKLDFQDQLLPLAEHYRAIAYDQRGHGESSNIGPYSLYGLAADLIGLLDRLDLQNCHVLGHSLGGMVVLRALLTHPQRFRSAILMDTAPYAVELFSRKIRDQLNALVIEQGCQALLEGMQGQQQSKVIQRGIDYLGEAEHWRRIKTKLEQMDPNAFVELGAVLSEQPSVATELKNITMPVTVLCGEHDQPFIQAAKQMADTLPLAQLAMIANAGHSPQYEAAEAWLYAVQKHLQWVESI